MKTFLKLSISQKKEFLDGWHTLGIKISMTSPNSLNCGSNIREELSKKKKRT